MIYTTNYTSVKPEPALVFTNRGEKLENLFNMSPSDVVFYVGGYPDNFTVSYPILQYTHSPARGRSYSKCLRAIKRELPFCCKAKAEL